MVRSHWLGALVAGLTWTGLLTSQSTASSSPAPNASSAGAIVNLNETGKSPLPCRVQASWTAPNGARVYQVQALGTAEIITLVEEVSPGAPTTPSSTPGVLRIYHWGNSITPPPGVPTLPGTPAASAPAPVAPATSPAPQLAPPPQPLPAPTQAQPLPAPAAAAPPQVQPGIVRVSGTPEQVPAPTIPPAPAPIINPSAALPATTPTAPTPAILPQPRDVPRAPAAVPAINPNASAPVPALPAINTQTPAQPQGDLMGSMPAPLPSAPANPTPVTTNVAAPANAPVNTAVSSTASAATAPCAGSAECANGSQCPPCPPCSGCVCGSSCGKPSMWNKMFGKSSCCCPSCPTGCSTGCSTGCQCNNGGQVCCTPCSQPSWWKRTFSKSSTCCPACPCPCPCPGETPAGAAAGAAAPAAAPQTPASTATSMPLVNQPANSTPEMVGPSVGMAGPSDSPSPSAERLAPQATPTVVEGQAGPGGEIVGAPVMAPNMTPEKPSLLRRWQGRKQQAVMGGMPPGAMPMPGGSEMIEAPMQGGPSGRPGMASVMAASMDDSAANADPRQRQGRLAQIRSQRQAARAGMSDGGQPTGRGMRGIELDANGPNAFTPAVAAQQASEQEQRRAANAFGMPSGRPMVSLPPPRLPQAPTSIPQAPYTRPVRGPQVMQPDAGIPPGMANAFTPSWTGRPLPADLDNRPQLGNAFAGDENMSTPPASPESMASGNAFASVNPQGPMGGYLPSPESAAAAASIAVMHKQAVSPPQMLSLLRDSICPSHREWAAEQLARSDWRQQQEIVDSLVEGASKDPAATVRAACVRSLGQMKVNTLPVVTAIQGLQRDLDLRVRQEASVALTAMGVTGTTRGTDGSVQRAGYQSKR